MRLNFQVCFINTTSNTERVSASTRNPREAEFVLLACFSNSSQQFWQSKRHWPLNLCSLALILLQMIDASRLCCTIIVRVSFLLFALDVVERDNSTKKNENYVIDYSMEGNVLTVHQCPITIHSLGLVVYIIHMINLC